VLNGADEAAVQLFLAGRIGFLDIPRRIEAALEAFDGRNISGLDEAVAISDWAYQAVEGAQG